MHPQHSTTEISVFKTIKNLLVFFIMGAQIFQKSSSHIEILGTRRVTQSKFHNKDPQIFGATAQTLDATVHPFYITTDYGTKNSPDLTVIQLCHLSCKFLAKIKMVHYSLQNELSNGPELNVKFFNKNFTHPLGALMTQSGRHDNIHVQ